MSEAGYTLTETLAAMAVIGLGIGGFSLGMQVLGAQQWRIGQTVVGVQDARAAHVAIEQLLATGAPYRSHEPERMTGDQRAVRFACQRPEACEVRVVSTGAREQLRVFKGSGDPVDFRLPGATSIRLEYLGSREALSAWPPAGNRQSLRAITLVDGAPPRERPLFEARVWIEQPVRCAFDPVLQDCG